MKKFAVLATLCVITPLTVKAQTPDMQVVWPPADNIVFEDCPLSEQPIRDVRLYTRDLKGTVIGQNMAARLVVPAASDLFFESGLMRLMRLHEQRACEFLSKTSQGVWVQTRGSGDINWQNLEFRCNTDGQLHAIQPPTCNRRDALHLWHNREYIHQCVETSGVYEGAMHDASLTAELELLGPGWVQAVNQWLDIRALWALREAMTAYNVEKLASYGQLRVVGGGHSLAHQAEAFFEDRFGMSVSTMRACHSLPPPAELDLFGPPRLYSWWQQTSTNSCPSMPFQGYEVHLYPSNIKPEEADKVWERNPSATLLDMVMEEAGFCSAAGVEVDERGRVKQIKAHWRYVFAGPRIPLTDKPEIYKMAGPGCTNKPTQRPRRGEYWPGWED